ncbi:hypothetical protein ACP70R_009791 [Stipagrostis hirtigluma subsp. patula]
MEAEMEVEAWRTESEGKGGRRKKGEGARRMAERLTQEVDKYLERKKKKEERILDPEEWTDPLAFEARSYERRWTKFYGRKYGRFDENTSIPSMRFTINPPSHGGKGMRLGSLQIFSVKVAKLKEGLKWPLDVFGMVAVRDTLDHKRNILFQRERGYCQTLTRKKPFLELTGPVRAVTLLPYVVFEVSLHVRGASESVDKELSLLAVTFRDHYSPSTSMLFLESYTSRLSTLDFKLGHIVYSVEATISIRVISALQDGLCFHVSAKTASIDHPVMLLDFQDKGVYLAGDEITLSRNVVSVQCDEKLIISVMAKHDYASITGEKDFDALEKGSSSKVLKVGGWCKFEVTVAWSLMNDSVQFVSYSETIFGTNRPCACCHIVFFFEVLLHVRGASKSDDKELSLLAVTFRDHYSPSTSMFFLESYTSRLKTLDFKLGHIVSYMEATISVRIISAPQDGFCCQFSAKTASIDHPVLLLDFQDKKVYLAGDEITLSRRVVSVEYIGKLIASVMAKHHYVTLTGEMDFEPLQKGTSSKTLQIGGLCKLEVTVAWSVFSYLP